MGARRVTTRSGRVLKVNTSLGGRWAEHQVAKARRKVERLRGQPKSRLKRLAWRLNPRRQAEYWFSRDGAITALKITGVAIFLFFVLSIGVFAFFRKDLQAIKDLSNSSLGGSLTFYDRTGKVFLGQDYDKVKRVPVPGGQISQYIKDATVAVEDRDFYSHRGFDLRGILRAAINDIWHRGAVQGGSTITQQLVKLSTTDWAQERTVLTKIKELILAVQMEREFSKDEILTQYLNIAPYGSLDYGVQVAASDYFHVSAKKVSLAQAAMLAAIPKSPSLYSPYNKQLFDKKAFMDRYRYVLDSMVEIGKLSKQRAEKAKKVNILAQVHDQQSKFAGVIAPYFMQAAENELATKFPGSGLGPGAAKGDSSGPQAWKVITTLDMKYQRLAERKVRDNIPNLNAHLADQSAVVVEDVPTGQYLALVGGLDFNAKGYGQINFAQWPISPGSSFKPYDYATLIDNHTNAGAGSVIYDSMGPIPGYPCTSRALPPVGNCLYDFDRRAPGPMTIRYALGGSRNIPAVKAMAMAIQDGEVQESIDKTVETADRLMNNGAAYACYKDGSDVTREQKADRTKCYTSAGIGDGAFLHLDQHTNGLASLGRMGLSIPATYILKVEGADGKPIYEWKQPRKGDIGVDQVVRPEAAYIVNNILSDGNASYFAFGTKFQDYNGWKIAVKTGTTNNATDGLMMAYTTKLAVGSWIGYHTRTQAVIPPMENITMPLTRDIIQEGLALTGEKPDNWKQPSGIQTLPSFSSRVAYATQVGVPATDVFPSWFVPPGNSSRTSVIDRVSNKLATRCTPPLARQTVGGSSSPNQFSIDIFYGPGAAGSGPRNRSHDDVHSCSDDPPHITLTISSNGNGRYTVSGAASAGTHPLTSGSYPQFPGTISLSVGGTVIKTCDSLPAEAGTCSAINYRPANSGDREVTARVTDSVLYEDSASRTYSFHAQSSPTSTPISFTTAQASGGNTKFAWTGGKGPFEVTRTDTGENLCSVSDRSCVYHATLPDGTAVRVEDSRGDHDETVVSS
ncbi:transglycosylase domain-containing protein [Candidatus Saccharibacteria bacterium]|nr:transglycosylase domain-containing protein [Candidatus Saccharibacteria bacterium]